MRLIPAAISSKPHYVFHPRRALRRMRYRAPEGPAPRKVTELPWGVPLEVSMGDSIGFTIATAGVFDPCVTETLHRLIDPGELVADVGANVGYMSSVAAVRTGPGGRVLAFEPHPQVFELLERNVAGWRKRDGVGDVVLNRMALSDHAGEGTLIALQGFELNMGSASLEYGELVQGQTEGTKSFSVPLERLDDVAAGERIGVMKIDVEGHEASMLSGARGLLAEQAIRDIVFEDHDEYPSKATTVVEEAGYELITLDNDLFGLRLGAPEDRSDAPAWPGPSYLATADPARARSRLSPRGWQVRGIGPGLPWRSGSRTG
jgi:FkbM family methyltransferase